MTVNFISGRYDVLKVNCNDLLILATRGSDTETSFHFFNHAPVSHHRLVLKDSHFDLEVTPGVSEQGDNRALWIEESEGEV